VQVPISTVAVQAVVIATDIMVQYSCSVGSVGIRTIRIATVGIGTVPICITFWIFFIIAAAADDDDVGDCIVQILISGEIFHWQMKHNISY